MAYLDDEALSREQIRQRMLANAPPIALGDPAMQQQPGVAALPSSMPQGTPFDDIMRQLGGLNLAPGSLNVKDTPALQAPVVSPRVSAPGSSTWKNDNSLAQALGGILGGGKGGGIQEMLAKLRALQAQRAAPTGNVARGANLPPPTGTTQAPARPPGPPIEQLIPGLQPPIDAKEYPPGSPAAKAYMQEHAEGPGVNVTGKPPPSAPVPAGQGYSQTLADQRAPLAAELDANPAQRDKLAAIMLSEEGGDSASRIRVVEAGANRTNALGLKGADATLLDPKYYQPMHDGSGNYEKALQRVQSDPKLKAQLYAEQDEALKKGSDLSKMSTDFASGDTAKAASQHATNTVTSANGEQFYRKDINDPIHGNIPPKVQDWYKNTQAARATESAQPSPAPETPTQQKAPGEPPGWLKDAVSNDAAEKGVPPGNLGSTDPKASQLVGPQASDPAGYQAATKQGASTLASAGPTPGAPPFEPTGNKMPSQALQDYGQTRLAQQPGLSATGMPGHMGEAHAALNLTPQEQALYQRHLDNLNGTGGVDNPPTASDPNPSRSSLRQISVQDGDKVYNIPTVYDGKVVPDQEAIARAKAEGIDKFPSYGSHDEAEARYQQMHQFMDKDTGDYFDAKSNTPTPGQPAINSPIPQAPGVNAQGFDRPGLQGALWQATQSNQPVPQMTPQLAKAIVGAVDAKDIAATAPGAAGPPPVMAATDVAPPAPGTPGGPVTSQGGAMTLPPGNAPLMMQQASQGNQIAMAGLSPVPPVQPGVPLSTTAAPQQVMPNALQPPIPYQDMAGWGWSSPSVDTGSWGGWSGGGFDGGFSMGGGGE